MRKLYEALSADVVKFEARDVITASGVVPSIEQSDAPVESNDIWSSEPVATPEPPVTADAEF